jgi:hypothetical protein
MARYEPYTTGIKTSVNRPVAGSELAVNNALETVMYGDNENSWVFNLLKRAIPNITVGTINKTKQVKPGTLSFVLYDDPITSPDETDQSISGELNEDNQNLFPVFAYTPDKKFNDGLKHQCLGILYNGKQLKIKFRGTNGKTGLPFFYVEDPVFIKQGNKWVGEQTQWYGTFVEMPTSVLSFGKRRNKVSLKSINADISYLRR